MNFRQRLGYHESVDGDLKKTTYTPTINDQLLKADCDFADFKFLNGPKTLPCGIPALTSFSRESIIFLFDSKDFFTKVTYFQFNNWSTLCQVSVVNGTKENGYQTLYLNKGLTLYNVYSLTEKAHT